MIAARLTVHKGVKRSQHRLVEELSHELIHIYVSQVILLGTVISVIKLTNAVT